MSWNDQTIKTYDESAELLAEYFKGVGPRTEDIERGLSLAKVDTNARVIEIGCGDGRDAIEIIKRVGWYEGFDPSEGLLKIARRRLPDVSFVKADALNYSYPKDLDVVYAFASLLHVNRHDIVKVFEKVHQSLRAGGSFVISLKERSEYTEELRNDEFGKRMFYYYSPEIIKEIAGSMFTDAHHKRYVIGKTDWFTVVLVNRS